MPRKIYDIKPPKAVRKARSSSNGEKMVKEIVDEGKTKKRVSNHKKENRPAWVPFAAAGAVVLLLACVFLYFKLQKVDIKIWPKIDTLSFQQNITADKSATLVDTTKNVIPAQYFEVSKTDSATFPATGSADNTGEATGTITVSNSINPPTPFTLKAGTHFISDSGKLFVSMQKIVIPAAKKSGSKVIPGTVQVQVQATEGGVDYNIAPASFTVPGLKGTNYFYSINATSSAAMTGGKTGTVKKVTDSDLSGAKDVLTKKATGEATAALKAQVSSDYVLLDTAIATSVTDASTKTKSGTVAQNFSYSVTVKASALAFKKSDLDAYAKQYLVSQLPDGKTLLDGSLKENYSTTTVDISGGKESLSMSFSSGIYQNVDKNSLSLSLLGENASQINETISNNLGSNASKVSINFWPFWTTSSPNDQSKINIFLQFK